MHHTLAGSGSEPLVLSWFGKPVGISTRAVRELLLTQAGAQETGSPLPRTKGEPESHRGSTVC